MFTRHGKLLLPALAGALLLGACESSSGSLSEGLTGGDAARLTIQLTDAPGSVKEAWVRIDSIYLQGSVAGDSTSGRQAFAPKSGDWINLLTLAGGKLQDLVTGAAVKPGTYTQVRLVLNGMYIRTDAGNVYSLDGSQLPAGVTSNGELKCESCTRRGLVVQLPRGGVTIDAANTTLLLDFDVKQSIQGHEAGKSGQFILRPVILATKKDDHEAGPGSIKGTVALATGVTLPACGAQTALTLAKFVPTATSGTTVKTGTVALDGTTFKYTVSNVAAGTYAMGADRVGFANGDTLTFAATATPASVTVRAGEDARADYSVTGATCKVKS
jgi:hypothetical protein